MLLGWVFSLVLVLVGGLAWVGVGEGMKVGGSGGGFGSGSGGRRRGVRGASGRKSR